MKKFPLVLAACLLLCTLAASATAQTEFSRPRQVARTFTPDGQPAFENDIFLVSEAAPALPEASKTEITKPTLSPLRTLQFNSLLMSAIERRLGSPYVYGATGPNVFDCSGFVWSVFQSAGVSFERVSARSLWNQYAPPSEDEKYKLGTLVFFNNLKHVGIVADANGFYHASSSHGVEYSPFNDYWTSRIVGFRRIPVPMPLVAE
ncbi:MAG: C40 family peptidase [Pyrinomonadaceae bacterium]